LGWLSSSYLEPTVNFSLLCSKKTWINNCEELEVYILKLKFVMVNETKYYIIIPLKQ